MKYPPYPISNGLRRSILSLFVLVFFITAPGLTLYTAGYKLDIKHMRFIKNGVLSIDAEPENIQVSLNNKILVYTMPLRVPNLAPGTYHLKIEKENYYTWEKNIVIEENKTTYIRDLHLFAKKDITLFSKETPTNIYPSPNGKYFLETTENDTNTEYALFDTKKQTKTPLFTKNTIEKFSPLWSNEGEYLALTASFPSSSKIYFLRGSKPETLASYEIPSPQNSYEWSEKFYGEKLLTFSPSSSYQMSYENIKEEAHPFVTSTLLFRDNNNTTWYFDSASKSLFQLDNKKENIYIGKNNLEKIIDINDARILVQTNNSILVIPRDNQKETKTLNAQKYFYIASKHEFLAWSSWEIWTIHEDGEVLLLNRMSEEIQDVLPLDENGTLFVATPSKLVAFNPGYYVFTTLADNIRIEKISNNIKERELYLLATQNNKRGIYKLNY